MKKILWLLLLISALALPAAAHDVPDLTQHGSISVTMRYDGSTIPGGELTLYRVGNITEDDGNYSFTLTGRFASAGISLKNVQSPETARELASYAKRQKIMGETEEISTKGEASFEHLQPGLYLLVQKKSAQGYRGVNPFLVSLPVLTEDTYSYHVEASPKMSPITEDVPKNPEQPKTGQSGWPIWTFIISGAALTVLLRSGYVHHNRKSRD